jgi:hypothetical protein
MIEIRVYARVRLKEKHAPKRRYFKTFQSVSIQLKLTLPNFCYMLVH